MYKTYEEAKKYVQEELDVSIVEEYEELGKKGLLPPRKRISVTCHQLQRLQSDISGVESLKLEVGELSLEDAQDLSLSPKIVH